MEQTKIEAMMDGKTLTKENILKMYQMVQNASDAEEKKNVMKHSVFFVGQLPLKENHRVDLKKTERIVNLTVEYENLDTWMNYLLEGLCTQTLLLKKENGFYEVNTRYEKSVMKVKKIVKAYQMELEQSREASMPKAKKMYQMGTKYYHDGDYEEAAACFLHAVDLAEYRMAYYSLAMMYMDGKGVEASLPEALRCVRQALVMGALIAEPLERNILSRMGAERL